MRQLATGGGEAPAITQAIKQGMVMWQGEHYLCKGSWERHRETTNY